MKKKIVTIGLILIAFILIVYGISQIRKANIPLEKAIVFLNTKGYKSMEAEGFGTISLYYYNVSHFDESAFSSTISLIDDEKGILNNINYTITNLEVENDIQLKRMNIILNLDVFNQFTINKIKLGTTNDLIFEVGQLELERHTFSSESTPQGYQITVSSFSDLVQSSSYQKYNISIRNNSSQNIQVGSFKAGISEIVNELLEIGKTIELSIDCTSYFDADYVLVNGFITYSYDDQTYGIHLEPMAYFRPLSGSDLINFIVERTT